MLFLSIRFFQLSESSVISVFHKQQHCCLWPPSCCYSSLLLSIALNSCSSMYTTQFDVHLELVLALPYTPCSQQLLTFLLSSLLIGTTYFTCTLSPCIVGFPQLLSPLDTQYWAVHFFQQLRLSSVHAKAGLYSSVLVQTAAATENDVSF